MEIEIPQREPTVLETGHVSHKPVGRAYLPNSTEWHESSYAGIYKCSLPYPVPLPHCLIHVSYLKHFVAGKRQRVTKSLHTRWSMFLLCIW